MSAKNHDNFITKIIRSIRKIFVDKHPHVKYSESMAIIFNEDYKNKIAYSLIIEINQAIKSGELPDYELSEVCTYITVAFKSIKSHEELSDFLKKMSDRWQFFQKVLQLATQQNNAVNNIENQLLNRNENAVLTSY